ncbi:hypothetical protein LTR37_003852 [Vermiconidia calcicola]|uniref:Uncharacterized protein n=1 Tax=Vermiconidia calcicola TaxID=1690605 RepID=A0ACC3NQM8_9PEZI|nr:hypothetical protein LTR37_003852 [Vermiconidia calcicola]
MAAHEGGVGPKQLLDLNDDVLYQICLAADQDELYWNTPFPRDVVAFCSTCKRIREIGTPLVFGKTCVRTSNDGSTPYHLLSIQPWLTHVGNSDLFLRHLKAVYAAFDLLDTREAHMFARILVRASNIQELTVLAPGGGLYCTEDLVRALGLCALPCLKRLVATPGLEGLISRFTSVVDLEIKGDFGRQVRTSQSLNELANKGKLRGLRYLRLRPLEPMTTRGHGWSPKVLEGLSTGTPQLRSLGVIGGHALGYSFESLLRAPDLFPCLEELTVDTLTHLGLCEMGHDCDLSLNPCKPPRWFCQHHIQDAIRYASCVAFTALPRLKVLNFSNEERTTCVREDDGSIANIVIDDHRVKKLTVEHTFDISEKSVWEDFLNGP